MNKTDLPRFFLQIAIIMGFTFLVSNFIGLARGGFDVAEALSLQSFYIIGGLFAFGIFALKMYETATVKGDDKYGRSVGFSSLGEKPHWSFFKRFTSFQIFLFFTILFSIAGLVIATIAPQTTFTGVSFLPKEQFTPTDSIIYSALLIPGAENFGSALLIAFVYVLFGIVARKMKMSPKSYAIIVGLLVVFAVGSFGIGNHLLRYRGFETTLFVVFWFWTVGGFLTAVTGSFLPFWVMHIMNNLFLDLQRFFTSETVLIFALFSVIALSVLYFILYRGRLLGKRI